MNPPPNDQIPFEKDNQRVSPPPPHPAEEKLEKKSATTPIAGSAGSPVFFSDPNISEPTESDDNEEDFHTYVRNLNHTTKQKVAIMESASEGRDKDYDDVDNPQDFDDDEDSNVAHRIQIDLVWCVSNAGNKAEMYIFGEYLYYKLLKSSLKSYLDA